MDVLATESTDVLRDQLGSSVIDGAGLNPTIEDRLADIETKKTGAWRKKERMTDVWYTLDSLNHSRNQHYDFAPTHLDGYQGRRIHECFGGWPFVAGRVEAR